MTFHHLATKIDCIISEAHCVEMAIIKIIMIGVNLPRYLGKTCCVQKCKRNRYQEFGHNGILRTCGDDDFYNFHHYHRLLKKSHQTPPYDLQKKKRKYNDLSNNKPLG